MRLTVTASKKLLAFLALLAAYCLALAAPVGQVTNLSGPLFAQNAEGVRRILAIGSPVEPGDTLITEGKTYAQVRFLDKGVVTLKPGTQFKIEAFAFDEKTPEKDSASFGLLKGALRTVTGLVGKRGNQDAYKMNTATATIGIRGTQFIAQYVPEPETAVSLAPYALPLLASLDLSWVDTGTLTDVGPAGLIDPTELRPPMLTQAPPSNGGMPPGTYVHVLDGFVQVSNSGGAQTYGAGQTGFTSSFTQPPVVLPNNPGVNLNPPPSFLTTQQQGQQTPPGAPPPSSQQQQQGEGCEVR
jgi:hypothetical protein